MIKLRLSNIYPTINFSNLCLTLIKLFLFPLAIQGQEYQNYLEKFDTALEPSGFEITYLTLDRNILLEKDEISFHAVTVDNKSKRIVSQSINLNIELLTRDGEIVDSGIFRLVNGIAHGTLPISLTPGRYILMAYTEQTRDLRKAFFKGLSVVDESGNLEPREQDVSLQVFPEGGQLVNDLKNTLVIVANEINGNGLEINGKITDDEGMDVGYFQTDTFGLAKIPFVPKKGISYQLVPESIATSAIPLPKPQAFGTNLHLLNLYKSEKVIFEITSTTLTENDSLIVSVFSEKSLKVFDTHHFTGNKLTVSIPYELLDQGIHQLELIDLNHNLIAKRKFYVKPTLKPINLKLTSDQDYIDLKINEKEPKSNIPYGVVSLTARGISNTNLGLEKHLFIRSILNKDITILDQSPNLYSDEELESLDRIMITLDSTILDYNYAEFQPKSILKPGLSYSIKFSDQKSGDPIANTPISYYSNVLPFYLEDGVTDENGIVHLQGLDFFDSADFIFQKLERKYKEFEIELISENLQRRKEVLPEWIYFPGQKERTTEILTQAVKSNLAKNQNVDYELEEFTITIDKQDYDDRYKMRRIFGKGKIKIVDPKQPNPSHPLILVQNMGVTVIPNGTGGYRALVGGRSPSIYWDGVRLNPATLIDNYTSKQVEEVEVLRAGAILFYSRPFYEPLEEGKKKLTLQGFQNNPDISAAAMGNYNKFFPVSPEEKNAVRFNFPKPNNGQLEYSGIDSDGNIIFWKSEID
ncbi:Plug domain-containing protein [Indibacter alkaliphilus]|nr:Plug domain-containing protein [Indibacter alkaliphilus]